MRTCFTQSIQTLDQRSPPFAWARPQSAQKPAAECSAKMHSSDVLESLCVSGMGLPCGMCAHLLGLLVGGLVPPAVLVERVHHGPLDGVQAQVPDDGPDPGHNHVVAAQQQQHTLSAQPPSPTGRHADIGGWRSACSAAVPRHARAKTLKVT